MGNCLITKLKSVVENSNLDYFGGIKIHVKPVPDGQDTETTRVIGAFGWEEAFIKNGSAYFTDRPGTANYGQHITKDMHPEISVDWTNYIRVSNSECDVIITSKYTMSSFICTAGPGDDQFRRLVDGDSLNYLGSNIPSLSSNYLNTLRATNYSFYETLPNDTAATLTYFDFKYNNYGSYSKDEFIGIDCLKSSYFKKMSNLQTLSVVKLLNPRTYESKITGPQMYLTDFSRNNPLLSHLYLDQSVISPDARIELVGNLINLTTLCLLPIVDGTLGGTVEAFVQAQRAAGRTTCEDGIFVPYIGWWGCTFNGQSITRFAQTSREGSLLTWTATTISLTIDLTTTTVNA